MDEYLKNNGWAKSDSSLLNLLALLLLVVFGALLAQVLASIIWASGGISLANIQSDQAFDANQRIVFRLGLIANHFGTFLLPAIIFINLLVATPLESFFGFAHKKVTINIALWGAVILFSYPLIALLTKWNQSIALPEFLQSSQEQSFALLQKTLQMEGVVDYGLSIILVGLLAGIGEEFIFRGIIQKKMSKNWNNGHAAVIVAAIIFGAFHMQFERFIPLTLLGLLLGYSYHFSKNILVPIILHILNNSIQVTTLYFATKNGEAVPNIDEIPDIELGYVLIGVFLMVIFTFIAIRNRNL